MTQFNRNSYIDPNKWHPKSFTLNKSEVEDILTRAGLSFEVKQPETSLRNIQSLHDQSWSNQENSIQTISLPETKEHGLKNTNPTKDKLDAKHNEHTSSKYNQLKYVQISRPLANSFTYESYTNKRREEVTIQESDFLGYVA